MSDAEPIWIHRGALLAIHDRLLADYGGPAGLRDEALLDSVLERPKQKWRYEHADIFTLAAAYAFGLAKNHAFIDGNKRIAFMAAYIFLSRNGYDLEAEEADVVIAVTSLAAGTMTENEFAAWLERHC